MTNETSARNLLLSALPEAEFNRLSKKLTSVPLVYNEKLFDPGDAIHHIYFPDSGIVSLLSSVDPACTLEVGLVGNEGMVGLTVFLGVYRSDLYAVIQGEGTAQRLSVHDFEHACNSRNTLPKILKRYIHSRFTQISQSAACNRFHQIDARLARWLLMIHDRMHADEFAITQTFLSNMLGVRREAVNKAAGGLQRQGLISYNRGTLRIVDRGGLELVTCPCYGIIRLDYDSMTQFARDSAG
jgi:CRP-like cAMP-binding protein